MSAGARPLRHVTLRHLMGAAGASRAGAGGTHTGPVDDVSPDKIVRRRGGSGRSKSRRVERRAQVRRSDEQGAGSKLVPDVASGRGDDERVDDALDAYESELAARGPMMSCAERVDWLSRWD